MDLDRVDNLHWPALARPFGLAERALGRLAFSLETTPLHASWLWREITRSATVIAQAGGYHAQVDLLRLALIGAPLDAADNTPGLAAAKRVFLTAAPLFRTNGQTDSTATLWPRFWGGDAPSDDGSFELTGDSNPAGGSEPSGASEATEASDGRAASASGEGERVRLTGLVRELASFADDGRRPALINLFIDLRKHAATRHLPPALTRIALPLALADIGLVPRAAPGLLGGRRLPLGFSRAVASEKPLTDWLKGALEALALEADQSYRRLTELTRQHQVWHDALAAAGLRRHARAPKALDLLAATPVLSIGLVARHLGCSHVASGKAIERLVDLGILIEQTSRSRHKVFIAGDLPSETQGETALTTPLGKSAVQRPLDVDAIEATLDGLYGELDRLSARARSSVAEKGR